MTFSGKICSCEEIENEKQRLNLKEKASSFAEKLL